MLRIFIVLVWLPFQLLGQLNEDFTDGNFTSQPEWVGQNAHFGVTNDGWLQLIAPAEAANSYLFTPSAVAENGSWRFKLKMDFNPSSSNYARIYLMADGASPLTIRNAVYVEMGNTTDDICLYYLLNGKVEKIIDGVDGSVNTSVVNAEVKISSINNTWVLESNTNGTWQSYNFV